MTAVTRNTEYDVVVIGGGAAGGGAETTWLDATAQADRVRRGEVSPKELAEAAIARIEAVNPRLDAVIRTRFEAARLEADGDLRRADRLDHVAGTQPGHPAPAPPPRPQVSP